MVDLAPGDPAGAVLTVASAVVFTVGAVALVVIVAGAPLWFAPRVALRLTDAAYLRKARRDLDADKASARVGE